MDDEKLDRIIALLETNNQLLADMRDGMTFMVNSNARHVDRVFCDQAIGKMEALNESLDDARENHRTKMQYRVTNLNQVITESRKAHAKLFGYDPSKYWMGHDELECTLSRYIELTATDKNLTRRKSSFVKKIRKSKGDWPLVIRDYMTGMKADQILVDEADLIALRIFFEEPLDTDIWLENYMQESV